MKSLSEYTRQIVQERDDKKCKFSLMNKKLKEIDQAINFLDRFKDNDVWGRIIAKSNDQALWQSICNKSAEIKDVLDLFISENGVFTIAKGRIDRDYVNVGAIGITREGKSEFTATTAKLDVWVLPRRAGKPCTTAPVNVINGSSKDGKTKFIRVHYNTVNEMAHLLYSFLYELGDQEDEAVLLNVTTRHQLKEWVRQNFKRIENDVTIGKSTLGSKKITFLGYLTELGSYIDRLRETSEDKAYEDYDLSDVEHGKNDEVAKKYYSSVSYFTGPQAVDRVFTSFATKYAEVYTTFDIDGENVCNLQFLDTPGIGEQKPGLKSILSEAITTKLDIILIVRAVNPNKTNTSDLEDLLDSIRDRLSGKAHARESVYFVLNMWETEEFKAKYKDGEDERDFIIKRLKQKQETDSIELPESHFRMIRVPSQIELLKDGRSNSNNPIGEYLKSIFNELIPSIKKIDEGFCESAQLEYNSIESSYSELRSMITTLASHLPKDDISSKVNETLHSVGEAWRKANAKLKDDEITGNIRYSIQEFCDNPTGQVLADFLNVETEGIKDFDAENDNTAFISDFCEINEDAILNWYDKGGWVAFDDFTLYTDFKKKFRDKLAEAIFDRIDAKQAQKILEAEKIKLAKYFMDEGRLSYFESDPSKWWYAITDAVKSMNYPPLKKNKDNQPEFLYEIFEAFAEFSIDYRKILSKSILQTLEICLHSDNFGNDFDVYNFVTHNSAMRTIIHSLLCIEYCTQTRIKQDVIEKELNSIMTDFRKVLNRLREVNIYGEQQGMTIERTQWEMFYKHHADVLFVDDESEKEQALITQWRAL